MESVGSSYDNVRSFEQLLSVNSHLYPDFKLSEVSEAYVGSLLRQLKTSKAVGLSGEASPTFGHTNANLSVFVDRIRNQFLKK